jgi:ATP-binding cassette, subfamily B, multidrug efflux pump
MKKTLSYLRSYKKATFIALFLMVLELAFELIQPILMGIIIDEGVVKQDLATVLKWGSVLLGLSLLIFIGGLTSSFFAAEASQGIGYELRKDLYRKIQNFTTLQFQKFSSSSLITRLTNDVTQIQGFVFMGLRIMLRAPLFILLGVAMAFTVHVKLAFILAVAVPISIMIMLFITSKGVRYFTKVQVLLDSINSVIRENLIGIRLVKAFNRGSHEEKRFNQVNKSLMENNRKALRFMELGMPIIMFGMNISLIIVIWVGALDLNVGDAEPGDIVAIINYGTRILASISMFSFLMMNFSRGRASALRISEVLTVKEDEEQSGDKPFNGIKGEVTFQNVSFSYPAVSSPVLNNISFHIHPGETIGIIGETGSGKSTLVQLIPRLYEPTNGHILIDQTNLLDLDKELLRKAIGLVPQQAHLFSGTILENIRFGNEHASMDEVMDACKKAKIHDFIMRLPEQYDTVIGQRGVNLSGGQKQRLSIARALVRRPKILILDDSTSALDANTEVSILQEIRTLNCTTLLIAQKISSVMEVDQILLLRQGNLVACGTHEELMANNSYYQSIFHSQKQGEVFQYES